MFTTCMLQTHDNKINQCVVRREDFVKITSCIIHMSRKKNTDT